MLRKAFLWAYGYTETHSIYWLHKLILKLQIWNSIFQAMVSEGLVGDVM